VLNIPENYENVSLSGTAASLEVFPLRVNKAHLDMLVSWKPDWMPVSVTIPVMYRPLISLERSSKVGSRSHRHIRRSRSPRLWM
jgi:hypothetical protein